MFSSLINKIRGRNKEKFIAAFLEALKGKYPNVNVRHADGTIINYEIDEFEINTDIYNGFQEWVSTKEDLSIIIDSLISSVEITLENPSCPDMKLIIPIIRRSDLSKDLYSTPVTQDLSVYYVYDTVNSMHYLTQEQLNALAIAPDTFAFNCLENLRVIYSESEVVGGDGKFMLTNGNGYESSFILLDELWNKGNIPVKGEYVFSIPNRDMLLISGAHEIENLKVIKEIALRSFNAGSYPVSPLLYRIDEQGKFIEP